MLVSHCKKFVFLHVPKTGGSSITKLLAPYLDTVDPAGQRYSGMGWQKTHHVGTQHDRAVDHAELLGRLAGYFVFAFVRNPWERVISLWKNWSYPGKYEGIPLAEGLRCLRSDGNVAAWTQRTLAADASGRRHFDCDTKAFVDEWLAEDIREFGYTY